MVQDVDTMTHAKLTNENDSQQGITLHTFITQFVSELHYWVSHGAVGDWLPIFMFSFFCFISLM